LEPFAFLPHYFGEEEAIMTNEEWFLGLFAEFKDQYDRSLISKNGKVFFARETEARFRRLLVLSLKASMCLVAYHLNWREGQRWDGNLTLESVILGPFDRLFGTNGAAFLGLYKNPTC